MNFLSNIQAAQWILNLVFNSIIIVGIGWVFVKIFRRKTAPVRSGLILMILIILMLLPVLSITPAIPNLNPLQITLPISLSSPVQTNIESSLIEVEGATAEAPLPYTKNKRFLPFSSALSLIKILNGIGIIWGLGFLICLIRFFYRTKSMSSFKKDLIEINDAKMTRILKSIEDTFGKRIRFRIFLTNSLTTPIVLGMFRPIVIIPSNLYVYWNENTLKSILLHELSHIYHKDNLTGILQRLATSLNWWNPLVYILSADFSRAREEISDNHVLLENNSRDYAECLISLAENKSLINRLVVFTPITSPYIPLNDRVKYILSKERRMETHLKKSSFLLILVVSVFLLSVTAGNMLVFATPPDSVSSPELIQEKSKKEEKISPPELLKKVEPVYPKEAIEAKIEGTVVLEATTNNSGQVQKIKVLKSVPGLDKAAIDAVRQWEYKPIEIDGKPRAAIFTIALQFQLDEEARVDIKSVDPTITAPPPPKALLSPPPPPPKPAKADKEKKTPTAKTKEGIVGGVMGGVVGGVIGGVEVQGLVRAVGDIKPPKLIKRVEPIYPAVAREAKIEGVVIVEATTGIYGRVQNVKVLRSIPLLDQAAVDAVFQWEYEPFVMDGKPKGIIFTVTVVFKLDGKTETHGPVRALGDIKPPRLIKMVEPVYPKAAKEANIEGVVIVELTTGIYGRVQNVKVLRSIPLLDQAAVDAVFQWEYEPFFLDGKLKGVIFTATVVFKLKEGKNELMI